MWLRTLRLTGFRNYESIEIDFGSGLNFLHGPNGSGKTSVLEAVSYLAVARSLRSASDAEVVRWGDDGFGVGGVVEADAGSETIVLRFTRGGGKEVTVGGETVSRLADLVGHLRVAWFSPEDTWITKGGPDARRKLLDMTLCQTDGLYLAALSGYRRALRQRNEALLAWTPDEESDRVVETWTDRVVDCGSRVIAGRVALLPRLAAAAARFHKDVSGEDSLSIAYRSSVPLGGATEEGDVRERFAGALADCAEDEHRRGFTLVGPHRDDIDVRLGRRPLRSFGSQGQHRTAAIALKLGEAEMLDCDGRGVVVLLDDVLSELDGSRAEALVAHMGEHGQAFVTSTTSAPGGVPQRDGAVVFLVDGGEVTRQ